MKMKAAIYRRYGPPDVVQLEDVAMPVPKDNEILVRVHATTVCATDSRIRKADYFIFRLFIGLTKPRKPFIAGVEFSGRVVQVGKDVSLADLPGSNDVARVFIRRAISDGGPGAFQFTASQPS